MAKKVQDMVPPRRSIRQIELPREKAATQELPRAPAREAAVVVDPAPRVVRGPSVSGDIVSRTNDIAPKIPRATYDFPSPDTASGLERAHTLTSDGVPPRSRSRLLAIGLTAVAFAIGLIFVVLHVWFSGAEVMVQARQAHVTIEGVFEAVKTPSDDAVLPYEVMTIRKTLSQVVPASGEESAEIRASGMITIYNNFSDSPQRLIKNTRFESPDGLIYRIQQSVEVPGRRFVGGSATPGELTVEVVADAPGEEYNINPSRFTIPGLKGDPRFEAVYAESKAPIQGGFVGKRKIVDPAAAEAAVEAMRRQLVDELTSQAKLEKPPGFVLFDGAVGTEASELPRQTDERGVLLTEEVTLTAAIFNTERLSTAIATMVIPDFDHAPVEIPNVEALSFVFGAEKIGDERMTFSLAGEADVVWVFDEAALRRDLVGKSKSKEVFNAVLSTYPGIESGRAYIRPFWQQAFPGNADRISIIHE